MAKKAFVYDGSQWVDIAQSTVDLSAYQASNRTGLQLVVPTSATNGTISANGAVTIGTGVSSVTVNGAFSSTYDNYKIMISGGVGSTANNIGFTLGATTTGYYEARINCNYAGTISANTTNNGSFGNIGQMTTQGLFGNLDILGPFLNTQTNWGSTQLAATTSRIDQVQGMLNNTISYTSFTITPGAGTLTGGRIRIYGYNNGA